MLNTLKQLAYGTRVLLSRNAELSTVEVAGVPTEMRTKGNGPPFVYLHSALGETVWLPFLDKWAQQFTVFAPAHPGYAGSGGYENLVDIEDVVFHYADLFDTLGLEKVNLGGVSLGGWIAVEFATRWPDRVSHLWLADAPGLWLDAQPLPDLFRHLMDFRKLRELMFADPNGYHASMILKDPDTLGDETRLAAYQSMAVLARLMWERPYNPRLPRRLRRVTCPTLIVWGEQDRLIPLAYAHEWQRLLPAARMHIIKNCGHLPMFEAEAEFVDVISRFCREG